MDKWIEKLLETSWFMKVVALVLALLLFDAVYDPDKDVSNIYVPGQQGTEVIADVPVKSYYDTENLVITGVPETVEVTIKGPQNVLQPTIKQRNFEVYVDLSDVELGTERVPLKISNISDKLKVTIDPAYVDVNIQEKITNEYKVDVDFDTSLLENGYISEAPSVTPSNVRIIGSKDVVERISYVKASVDLKGPINETIAKEVEVQAFDRNMNKLDVTIDPGTVEVVIPVKSLSKTVPIDIVEKGTPQSGIRIDSIDLNTEEAKIYGRQDILEKTDSVRVEVDVSKITGDTELTLPVIISDGITEVNPQTVKATIHTSEINEETEQDQSAENDENKTFSNLPIELSGLSNEFEASLDSPANGATNLTVTGKSDLISEVDASDFKLFLDLSKLGEGDHEVKINVSGPANVDWKLATETAKVTITEKEAI